MLVSAVLFLGLKNQAGWVGSNLSLGLFLKGQFALVPSFINISLKEKERGGIDR